MPHIPCEVFIRGGVDAEPGANQIADRFRLKLTNGKREILAIWPPSTVWGAQMAAIQMGKLVNERAIPGFSRKNAVQ